MVTTEDGNKTASCEVTVIKEKVYEVNFDTQGGSNIEKQIVKENEKIIRPEEIPIKSGYTFAGWYQEASCENKYDFDELIARNVTLYAKWIPDVINITLNKNEVSLTVGDIMELIATIEPEDALNKNIIWSSSNEDIATVSKEGMIIALAEGNAIITATTEDGGKEVSCKVTVEQKESQEELGDVDYSGKVDSLDALIVLKITAGLITPTEKQEKVADVNGDGKVDSLDALLILKYVAGLITEL